MTEKPKHKKLPIEYMPQVSNVVSDTECTGIGIRSPQNEDEAENEMDLWSTSLPPVWDEEDIDEDEKTPHE